MLRFKGCLWEAEAFQDAITFTTFTTLMFPRLFVQQLFLENRTTVLDVAEIKSVDCHKSSSSALASRLCEVRRMLQMGQSADLLQ